MRRSGFTACLLSVAFMIVTAQSAGLAQNLEPFRDWFGSYGFTDSDGNIVIECRFDDVRGFTEGLAPVLSRSGNVNGEGGVFGSLALTLKWGYIDTSGIIVIPCVFDLADQFSEGYAAVMSGNKWGFIDHAGDTLVTFKYDEVHKFVNGFAAVRRGGRWGYVDTDGRESVSCIYDVAGDFGPDGFAAVTKADSSGYVFRNGSWYATKDRALNWIRGIPFSVYAKDKVMNMVDEWQRREPGESVPDWEVRVNDETLMARIEGLEMRFEAEYLTANQLERPECLLGLYDTVSSSFLVRIVEEDDGHRMHRVRPFAFALDLHVPVGEAADVADGWRRVRPDFVYFVDNDRPSIALAEFALPGKRVYGWTNPDYTPERSLILDYDMEMPDFTVPGKIYREMRKCEGDSSVVVDVDAGISAGRSVSQDAYAVIIANEHYRYGEEVPYAVHDGEVFYDYCIRRLGIPKDNIKFVRDATSDDLRSVSQWLSRNAVMFSVDTRVVVYFSGKCTYDSNSAGPFLLPIDHVIGGVQNGLSLKKMYSVILGSSADNALFLVDASYGDIVRNGMHAGVFDREDMDRTCLQPEDRMVVFYAAGDRSGAYPYPEKKHGLFTYFLLKELQSHPYDISYGDLFDRISSGVKDVSERLYGSEQVPEVYSSEWDGEAWRDFYL